ncbi:MAG: hypothetical protein ABEI86_00605 [Halobacteriaceae archaeon]
MYTFREGVTIVLGIIVGALLVFYPAKMATLHLVGRGPTGRRGPYGEDNALSNRWKRVIQAIGIIVLLISVFFILQPFLI